MSLLPVDWREYLALFELMRHVTYDMGAKVASLHEPPDEIEHLDCSGFERYMDYNCAGGLIIPDGSQNQLDWCRANLTPVSYSASPGALTIAFLSPHINGNDGVGHVWKVKDGKTYECDGDGGVNSRGWDLPVLMRCSAAFNFPLANTDNIRLYNSVGTLMDTLLMFNNVPYVRARAWGHWMGLTDAQIGWNAVAQQVIYQGRQLNTTTRIIKSAAYIPLADAAARFGVDYTIDATTHKIQLVKRSLS